jgi:hypothetical protein
MGYSTSGDICPTHAPTHVSGIFKDSQRGRLCYKWRAPGSNLQCSRAMQEHVGNPFLKQDPTPYTPQQEYPTRQLLIYISSACFLFLLSAQL